MAKLQRTIKKNGMRSVVDRKGRRVTGINVIMTSIRRKQLPFLQSSSFRV